MVGKTHAVSALLLLHGGLFGYSIYAHHAKIEPVSFFNFSVPTSLSFTDYLFVLVSSLLFIALLLRVGSYKLLTGYAFLLSILLVVMKVFLDRQEAFSLALLFICYLFGSLFPDIDAEDSELGRYFPFISMLIPHRTITHTFWLVALFGGLGFYFGSIYLIAFTMGCLIHIVEDSFSRQGICWFYPILGSYLTYGGGQTIKKNRYPTFYYTTDGLFEMVFLYSSILLNSLLIVLTLYNYLD